MFNVDHLRDIFDAMLDAILVVDRASLQIRYANQAILRLTGYDQALLSQMCLPDVYAGSHRTDVIDLTRQANGKMVCFEAPLFSPDNIEIPAETQMTTSEVDGRSCLICVIRDIRHRENLLHLQRALSIALSAETNLNRALQLVVETAAQIADMDCGGIYLVDPVSGAQEMVFHLGLSDEFAQAVSRFDSDAPQTAWLMQGKPIYSEYYTLGADLTDIQKHENLRAVALNPVFYQNQVIAGFLVASHTADQIPAPTRDALENLASCVGSAIVRIRAEEARRESEETTRALLNASRDMAMMVDRNLTVLAINEPFAKQFGASVEEIVGTNVTSYLAPDIVKTRVQHGEKVWRYGKPIQFEDTNRGRHFDNCFYPLFNTRNEVTRVAVFARDITDQKKAEEALRQKGQLLEGVAKATSHLMTTGDQETVFNEALALFGTAAHIDRVFIFENHAHPETGEPVASYRFGWASEDAPRETPISKLQDLPWQAAGLQHWYDVLSAGQELKASRQDLADLHLPGVSTRQITSLLIVPVFANRRFWGGIGFDNRHREREWHPGEINALRTMATGVGAAIERQLAEDRLRHEREIADHECKIADTLREVGIALTSTLELDKVLAQILEQARRVVPYDAANVFLLEDGVARLVHQDGYTAFGLTEDYLNQIKHDPEKMPVIQKLIQDGVPYMCREIETDPSWRSFPGFEWDQSWLGVPIVVRGEVVGYFSFDAAQKDFFGEEHVRLIVPFARQAAVAIENALLFEDTQRLEQVKSEMIRMASHDLRSPLTRIKETLRRFKGLSTDRDGMDLDSMMVSQDQYCVILDEAAQEMEQIIVNILSLEQIEARHRKAKSIVWCELLAECVGSLRADLEANHHRLSVECEPNLPITRGDPVQLQRAMINLIGNAIKYTPPEGHIQVRIFRNSYGGTPTVAFEVQDSGIGIPLELQEQLFQPFYRAEQSGTEDISGLGLGLSIVKAAIKYHKGNVYVDSDPGHGSLFGFWVPV